VCPAPFSLWPCPYLQRGDEPLLRCPLQTRATWVRRETNRVHVNLARMSLLQRAGHAVLGTLYSRAYRIGGGGTWIFI
jgi:hypothetical protein